MPFKALAWEDSQGKVWVSYANGTYMDQRYAIKGAASYVKNIDETIEKLICCRAEVDDNTVETAGLS